MSVIWYTQANYSDLMVRDLKWLLLFTISHIDPWPYNISMIVQLISIKLDLFSLANLIIISIFLSEEYSKKVLCCWKEVVIRASRRKITPTPQKKEKKIWMLFSLIFDNIILNFPSIYMKTFCELLHVHMNYCEWRKLVNSSFYQIVKYVFISYINKFISFICIP